MGRFKKITYCLVSVPLLLIFLLLLWSMTSFGIRGEGGGGGSQRHGCFSEATSQKSSHSLIRAWACLLTNFVKSMSCWACFGFDLPVSPPIVVLEVVPRRKGHGWILLPPSWSVLSSERLDFPLEFLILFFIGQLSTPVVQLTSGALSWGDQQAELDQLCFRQVLASSQGGNSIQSIVTCRHRYNDWSLSYFFYCYFCFFSGLWRRRLT